MQNVGTIGIQTSGTITIALSYSNKLTGQGLFVLTASARADVDSNWKDLAASTSVQLVPGDHLLKVIADDVLAANETAVTFSVPAGAAIFLRTDSLKDGFFYTYPALKKLGTGKNPWPDPPPSPTRKQKLADQPAVQPWYEAGLAVLPASSAARAIGIGAFRPVADQPDSPTSPPRRES
jgi:hypothetical protein